MEIKKIYTVNGVDYTDLKEAKRANARLVLEKEFGAEIVNKMLTMKGFASMFHALKGQVEVAVETAVEAPKVPKNKKVQAVAAVNKAT